MRSRAAGVAGELVLVARPGAVGDLLLHAGAHHAPRARSRRARCALPSVARRPVLGRGVDRGRERQRAHVGEQRAQLVVDDQRVARRAAGGREQHRLGDDQVVVEHVDERLEQPADAGLVDRGGGDDRVGGGEPVDRLLELLAGEAGDGGASGVDGQRAELDHARPSRRLPSRSRLFWARRSVSWRVEDGLPVPALMTTRRVHVRALSVRVSQSARSCSSCSTLKVRVMIWATWWPWRRPTRRWALGAGLGEADARGAPVVRVGARARRSPEASSRATRREMPGLRQQRVAAELGDPQAVRAPSTARRARRTRSG